MGKMPSHLWAGSLALLMTAVGFIRIAKSETPTSFALDYQVAPGAQCPKRADVELAVQREAGRPILDGAAVQQAILAITPSGADLVAQIAFTNALGGTPAYRTVSAPLQDCQDLVRIFALLVALRAQGVEPEVEKNELRPRRPRSETPASPEEQTPRVFDTIPVTPRGATPAVVNPPETKPNVAPTKPWLALTLGPGLRTGFAPHVNPTLRFGVSVESSTAAFRVNVEAEGIWGGQHALSPKGAYTISGAALVASTCWSPRPRARVSPWLCPVVTATFIHVDGEGLDVSQTDQALGITGGLDARFRMALSEHFYVEAVLGVAFNPYPHAVQIGVDNVFKSQDFSFNSALVLGYRLGATVPSRTPASDLSTTTVQSKQ